MVAQAILLFMGASSLDADTHTHKHTNIRLHPRGFGLGYVIATSWSRFRVESRTCVARQIRGRALGTHRGRALGTHSSEPLFQKILFASIAMCVQGMEKRNDKHLP